VRADPLNVPGRHSRLTITAQAIVESTPPAIDPAVVSGGSWEALDDLTRSGEFWDLLVPSQFAEKTDALFEFARSIGLARAADPLTTLRGLMRDMYERFEYSPLSTRVDSPIDEALRAKRGVCQDFSHIFIALARHLGVPTRYVSGYLFGDVSVADRSTDGATHAWAEALIPDAGWIGLDPTNNLMAGERHIRVAIGRDYADVPPTRGSTKARPPSEASSPSRFASAPSMPLTSSMRCHSRRGCRAMPAHRSRTATSSSSSSSSGWATVILRPRIRCNPAPLAGLTQPAGTNVAR
jgi:transglutaminase-like putative cysteine protease